MNEYEGEGVSIEELGNKLIPYSMSSLDQQHSRKFRLAKTARVRMWVKYNRETDCSELFFFFFVFLPFLGLLTTAYGGSQARGAIRAVATVYTTATAMRDLSHFCDLHHSSWKH